MNKIELAIESTYPTVYKHISNYWAKLSGRNAAETTRALLSVKRARYLGKIIEHYSGSMKDKRVLELGSGYSIFLAVAIKEFRCNACGIEPAEKGTYGNTFTIGKEILRKSGLRSSLLKRGRGEHIPYSDNTFDIVTSNYILEHTLNHQTILEESIRVLKKGGYLIFVIPNYSSFWEGHYGIIWLPFLNKNLARIYLKILGKNPQILNEINFTNQWLLERIMKKINNANVISWGADWFAYSLENLNFPNDNTLGDAKHILKIISKFKIAGIISKLSAFLKCQTPIILVAKKIK